MPDLGQKLTDERVDEINKRLLAVYTEAAKDLQKKAEAHAKYYQEKEKRLQAEVNAGKKTQEYVDRWKAGQVFIGKQWQSKVDQMTRSLVDTERQAVEIVNGGQLDCFADNANYFEYRIDRDNGFGANFSLYDETTVKGLIEQEPELMRRRYVDGQACEAWNRKIISNCITQGILQGEKIGDIAKRIARDTASTDMKAMVRYARTAMTCAQNAGRLQAMHDSQKRGIYCKKVWIAVDDERTREAHSELDGQTAEIDEPFDSLLGEIMYPGDPGASDENVWNCRCALGYEYPDPPAGWQEEEMSLEDEEEDFDEWVEEKQEEPEHIIAQGTDITESWERREDDFDFEIEDVINAQGFDGLPQIVSQEEFDKAVQESGLYAQRVYSANSEEALSMYRNELYNGKFYVDCSIGGSDFGQGMYASGDFTGTKVDSVKADSEKYVKISQDRGNLYSYTEKITLQKDANIVTYDNLMQKYYDEVHRVRSDIVNTVGHNLVERYVDQYSLTPDDRNYLLWGLNISKTVEPFNLDSARAYSGDKKLMGSLRDKISKSIDSAKNENSVIRANGDMGIYGALKGYDAVNIEGQAANGTSQVLILNRTKCIFLGDE